MVMTERMKITALDNGPYLVKGPVVLLDAEGNEFFSATVALYRRGGSQNKPFCDGTHSKLGFRAAETIDHTRENLVGSVLVAHPDGIEVVVDVVSDREALSRIAGLVKWGGKVASFVYAADAESLARRGIEAPNVGTRPDARRLAELARLVDAGDLREARARLSARELPRRWKRAGPGMYAANSYSLPIEGRRTLSWGSPEYP
jgi:CDGSH-type Zn-finger protein